MAISRQKPLGSSMLRLEGGGGWWGGAMVNLQAGRTRIEAAWACFLAGWAVANGTVRCCAVRCKLHAPCRGRASQVQLSGACAPALVHLLILAVVVDVGVVPGVNVLARIGVVSHLSGQGGAMAFRRPPWWQEKHAFAPGHCAGPSATVAVVVQPCPALAPADRPSP